MITGEALFCTVMETQYDAFVAIIEIIISIPQVALQILKSLLQAAIKTYFVAIRFAIVSLEQLLISALNFDGLDLSKTKDNLCEVLWQCAFLKDYLIDKFNISNDLKDDYQFFEDLICGQGLRSFAEDFVQNNILDNLDELLNDLVDDVDKIFVKANKAVEEFTQRQLTKPIDLPFIDDDYSFLDLMEKLDTFAQCAFATCNFALTSSNKKEDLLDGMGVAMEGGVFTLVVDEWTDFINEKDTLLSDITAIRTKLQEDTPQRGVQPDEISRN